MDSSQLSRLPPEVRDQIYTMVFSSKYAVTLQPGLVQHSLTKTCRQIRQETLAMYYALTRFNAHLDDGPATPLARWLTTLGPELTLTLDEINIWDIRMLNGTLRGSEGTRLLPRSHDEYELSQNESYVLRPIGNWVFNRGWYLKDVILALHSMGLGLSRLSIESTTVKLTSDFAIIRLPSHILTDEVNALVRQSELDLSEEARENMILQLAAGKRAVSLEQGDTTLRLMFDGSRVVRQATANDVKEDEHWRNPIRIYS